MRRALRALVVLVAVFATACGWMSCESPIERERRELAEASESSEGVLYRGIKVTLRSAPLEPGAAADPSASKVRQLTASIFQRLLKVEPKEGEEVHLSPEDYVLLAKELYELRDELRVTDEDDYPTILAQLVVAQGDDPAAAEILKWYDSAWEHLVLALLWTGSQKAPQGFVLYELSQLDPAELQVAGVRVASRLVRAAAFYQYKWPWMAEEELDAYLEDLEASRDEVIEFTRTFEGAPPGAGDDVVYAQWHAPGVLLRALVRFEKKEDDAALDDLDAFLADADTLGIDDEGVWLVGAYVGIRREDPDRALENLRKLQGSPMLDDDAKKLVTEAIAAIEDRDPDSAFNRVNDKVLVAKIVGGYLLRVLGKLDWRKELESSESGRALLRFDGAIETEVERTKAALSPEQLSELSEQAAASARALGQKTKQGAAEAWQRAVGD
jgi:hypothetical protein